MSHLYRILGVSETCTDDELKKAFQKKALLWHPDRQPDEKRRARAEHMFKEISTSYNSIIQLRENGQDALFEMHAAEQAHRRQHGSSAGWRHPGAGGRHPGAGGMGNEQRDWQAHRAAYDKANRVPKDAPRRILFFCTGIVTMGMVFNMAMLYRTNSIEPSNDLIAGRASFITLSKGELRGLWSGMRTVQAEHAAVATSLPEQMRVFSGKSLAARISKRRLDEVT